MDYSRINADFGKAMALMSHSGLHNTTALRYVYSAVMPPIILGQYLIMQDEAGAVVGFVSWARLNADTEKKYLNDPVSLDLEDWNSGEKLWITDFVCLAGKNDVKRLIKALTSEIFPNDMASSIRIKGGYSNRRIKRYKGIAFKKRIDKKVEYSL